MHKKKKKKSKTDATPIASKECTGSIPEARTTDCKSKLDDLKDQHLDQEGSINHFSQSDPLKICPLPQVDVLKDLNASSKKHGLSMAAPTSEPEAVIHPCLQTEHPEPVSLGCMMKGIFIPCQKTCALSAMKRSQSNHLKFLSQWENTSESTVQDIVLRWKSSPWGSKGAGPAKSILRRLATELMPFGSTYGL
ncbi:hypothetical protein PCASD_15075 [Puccinia coronata f. sp. avenae]|uniref:Uncharacterized protein n=1 Tax=Puccinia coronata f. sp. avenae TaxID=200324 RepID=A0A2N5UAU7_9BASI|nr:hypothetical protein PCASD_15075 [Puccinia coronata f. sp. avenae]